MAEASAEAIRARENYVSSIVEGFSSLAESLAEDGDIEFSELDGIITALQQKGIIDGGTY